MNTTLKFLTLAGLSLSFCVAVVAQSGSVDLVSPDTKLRISFQTVTAGNVSPSGGQLVYSVTYAGKPVIAPSRLGLALEGQPALGDRVRIVSSSRHSRDGTYEVVHGKSNPVRDHYDAVRIELAETGRRARSLIMEARAYNDGVAFRYVVPDQPQVKDFRLADELTEFRMPKDSPAYPLLLSSFHTSYEDSYVRRPVSRIASDRLIALPLLINLPGTAWVAITEAHLEDYAGMYLKRDAKGTRTGFSAALSPSLDKAGLKVLGRTPHSSPWRVVMVAPEVGRLIESNIVINLNPPLALADTSWIKPGKSTWDWWFGKVQTPLGFETGMNTRTFNYLIDFAAKSGFDYVLVDDGWSDPTNILEPKPGVDIAEILHYAKSKGIGIWLWLRWTGVDKHMNEAFPLYEKWGVKGVKIDFMDRDDQWMVDFYHRVVKQAAEHRLMVDFHGAYKPAGMRRTYPNLMTREGVMGLEYTKWSAAIDPQHTLMLPFTRMLAGPLDFTPGGFRNVTLPEFNARFNDPIVMGTRAHHLAMLVVYESPYLVLCDHPSAYEGEPAFEFAKQVPATWDETRVVNAWVGDYITIARRRGKEWFVGSMTDWSARELSIPFSFLGEGRYTAEIYADAPDASANPKHVTITKKQVYRQTVLTMKLAPGGGNAIRVYPSR